MIWSQLVVFVLALWPRNDLIEASDCKLNKDKIVKNLSTKTPYAFMLANVTQNEDLKIGDSCKPKQLWLLLRHGTRYPSNSGLYAIRTGLPKLVKEIEENHVEGRGQLCADDVRYLSNWVSRLVQELGEVENLKEKHLHPEGQLEHILLAERFRSKFPGLLSEFYKQGSMQKRSFGDDFKFRATKTERAIKSQFFFATGLFDRKVAQTEVNFEDPIKPHDPLIRFYKTCPKWIHEVKKSPKSLAEQKKFETSDLFVSKLVSRLSSRLGFFRNLTLPEIDTIFVSCVFSQAWQPKRGSAICQILEDEEVEILEYREDLEYFWQDGYGFEINYQPGCDLMKDVISGFEKVAKGEPTEKGVFYFTHSGTVLKFLAFLGLYRDDIPMTTENFDVLKNNRLWRTSHIDAFASNVAFVLKECRKQETETDVQLEVGLLHNERLIRIPGCSDTWCRLDELKQVFGERISQCDVEKICVTQLASEVTSSDAADDRF